MSDNPKWKIIQGDALQLLPNFVPGTFDAVITDPPYASGGAPRRRRTNPPPRSIPAWGTMRPRPLTGTPRTEVLDPLGGRVAQ